jgi:mycothiol synthase
VSRLVAASSAERGYPVADEARIERATHGGADRFWAALAWDDARTTLRGYVQAVRGIGGWDVEDVASPDLGGPDSNARRRLLRATLDAVAGDDGGDVRFWVRGATDADDRLAASLDLHPTREVLQIRRPLPADPPTGLTTRSFVVGQDEEAWLAVNNRAFSWHPEQGGWTLADVEEHEREPWFDPDGFLLHERDGRLAGFCWTKVHDETDPAQGEIYVIAVDPDFHGLGLGRGLVLAGLDHLHRTGLTVGMLYVDATNTPAIGLYDALGFTTHHADRVYTPA